MSDRQERRAMREKFEQFTVTIETADVEFVRSVWTTYLKAERLRGWQLLDTVRFVIDRPMTMTLTESGQDVPVEKFTVPIRTRLYRDGDIVRFAAGDGDEEFTTDILAGNQDLLERIDRRNEQVDEALSRTRIDEGLHLEVDRPAVEVEAAAAELTTAPSALATALTGFLPSKADPKQWAARRQVEVDRKRDREAGRLVTRGRVRVQLDNATRSRSQKRKPTDPTMLLPFEATIGPAEEMEDMMWSTLSALDTDCLLTTHAIIQEARETDNRIIENVSAIARRRGWSEKGLDKKGPSDRTRRQRVREHIDLLFQAEFHIDDMRGRGEAVVPLLVKLADMKFKGNRRDGRMARVFGINPLLWKAWMEKGRKMCFHPSLLHADPVRDDWAFRIGQYLLTQWAQGWAGDGYYATGGEQRVKVGTVVVSAGLHISKIREEKQEESDDQKKQKGRKNYRPAEPAAFRTRFRAALERLQAWPGSTGHIGAFEIVEKSDPFEDLLIVRPPAAVAYRLNQDNQRRIAARERRLLATN